MYCRDDQYNRSCIGVGESDGLDVICEVIDIEGDFEEGTGVGFELFVELALVLLEP